MSPAGPPSPPHPAKDEVRRRMRSLRRELTDRDRRSARIVDHLVALPVLVAATRVHTFTPTAVEPDVGPLVAWCAGRGVAVAGPDDDVDPSWPDVVVVPGLAFTVAGERLGQGGGWYDRFLTGCRVDATTIGVAFAPQLLDAIPVEDHDVGVDCVVTDDGPRWAR